MAGTRVRVRATRDQILAMQERKQRVEAMLEKVLSVMAKGSTVIFSTNHQRFDPKLNRLHVKTIKELTPKTIPEDYRNKLIHRCWQIEL